MTERTLRRDVERLRNLSYPVLSASGVAGGYQLGSGATLPPLALDDDEAVAVAMSLRTAASGSVLGIEDAALRAFIKLEQVLPKRLQRRMAALSSTIVPLGPITNAVALESLTTIANACRDHIELTFEYADRNGTVRARQVEPCGLVHSGFRWYLVAWDVTRQDFRTFRADRIRPPITSGAGFLPRPPPEGDLAAFVSRSVSTSVYSVQASVLINAPLSVIRERVSPSAAFLEPVNAERCRLRMGAATLDAIVIWVSMLGADFEVESPPALVERLRVLADRMQRNVQRSRVPV